MWFCYILRNRSPQYNHLTYNGSTNDPIRRLRQHNEEIKGGAKFTHGRGKSWEIYFLMTGFKNHINTLSCEWRIKHPTGKPGPRNRTECGVIGRIKSLNQVLALDKWTKPCTIQNSECNYSVYIVQDMIRYIDISSVPSNITIIPVPIIDKTFIESIMIEKIDATISSETDSIDEVGPVLPLLDGN